MKTYDTKNLVADLIMFMAELDPYGMDYTREAICFSAIDAYLDIMKYGTSAYRDRLLEIITDIDDEEDEDVEEARYLISRLDDWDSKYAADVL